MTILGNMIFVSGQFLGGDPTFFGWLTTLAYLMVALLCLFCALSAKQLFAKDAYRPHALVWGGVAIFLFLLGLNKELDLQTWFTGTIKDIAWRQGWYDYGQTAQVIFLFAFGSFGMVVVSLIAWKIRRYWRRYLFLLLGILAVFRFISVRIASFYGIYLPELSRFTGGIRINWLLELIGIIFVGVAAVLNLHHLSKLLKGIEEETG